MLRWAVIGLVIACAVGLAAQTRAEPTVKIDPQDRLADLDIEPQGDGYVIVHQTPDGGEERLTPEQYIEALHTTQEELESKGFLFALFNITGWAGVLWVSFGFLAQAIFAGRLIVQWLVSEKQRRSVVPTSYWWMSLLGATMLVVYFVWRKDIVGVAGQSTGWLIYVRNLWLIYRPAHDGGEALGGDMIEPGPAE